MSKKGIILGYLIFAVLIIFIYFLFQGNPSAEKEEVETQIFAIEKGEGLKEIGDRLEKEGIIKSSKLFQVYAFLRNVRAKFLPGEFHLQPEMSFKELVKTLISRPLAPEKTITIVEGLTNKEIARLLQDEGLVSQEDFFIGLKEVSQNKELLEEYGFLTVLSPEGIVFSQNIDPGTELQGFLFPDTYRFYEQTTSQAVIKKMLENFSQKVDEQMLAKIKESGRTLYQVITLASIIEKEAALDQDRRLIADIFWKRLDAGWALESCATVNYILGDAKPRLSFEDTRIPSLYNTYLHSGLPPGPINNPGLLAIKAAIEPLKSDYCCFLTAPDGQTVFSRTIEEHNRNKDIYLK